MFSGTVKIANINDFLTPNQACVNPLVNIDDKTKKVKISLADCLACSGCITSAETVLIKDNSLDNHKELIKKFTGKDNIKICCMSYQSVESLAYRFNIDKNNRKLILQIINRILETDIIFSLSDFLPFILELTAKNVLSNKDKLLINSECPGWICYAEKNIGQKAFEFMSPIQSIQLISSIIIRQILKQKFMYKNEDIYICSVSPCYDKKLESVRTKNEIDCVLTSIELEEQFEKVLKDVNGNGDSSHDIIENCYVSFEEFLNISCLYKKDNDINKTQFIVDEVKKLSNLNLTINNFISNLNFSSGFYVEYLVNKIMAQHPDYVVERKDGPNQDIRKITIYTSNTKDQIYKKFCISYGFKNIQRVIRIIKDKKHVYDFIEIGACPGGCLNGGGQTKTNNTERELIKKIEEELKNFPNTSNSNNNNLNEKFDIIKLLDSFGIKINENEFLQTFKEVKSNNFNW